jgi:hypothetical protein
MARKLWLAESTLEYESGNVLGVFTSKAKAIEECQRYEESHDYEDEPRTLEFGQHQTSEKHPIVFLANGHVYGYCVQEIEVNKSLMT